MGRCLIFLASLPGWVACQGVARRKLAQPEMMTLPWWTSSCCPREKGKIERWSETLPHPPAPLILSFPPEAMRFSSLPTHLLCIFSWCPVGHLSLIVILFLYREDKPLYRKFCRIWPHENSAPLHISLIFFSPLVARDTVFAAGAVEKALITKTLSGWKLTRAKSYFCLYCCVCLSNFYLGESWTPSD